MSCETASKNATEPSPAIRPGGEDIDARAAAEFAATRHGGPLIDPRVTALVPGFDAPFFQAGLAGYSDAAMRIIARRNGCPFCITEALLDRTLLAGGRGFAKADLGELHDNVPGGPEDQPLAGQIMGSDPKEMAASAMKMAEQGRRGDKHYRAIAYDTPGVYPSRALDARGRPAGHLRLPGGEQIVWVGDEATERRSDGGAEAISQAAEGESDPSSLCRSVAPSLSFQVVDINLACPVKKIDRKARGGHWLREPAGAIELLEAVREAVPAHIPCTVKLRRSYDDTAEMAANFEKIFDASYRIGYAWTTVHARTVEQKYVGPSRWDVLRDLMRRHPERIVFGSGDVWSVGEIFRMIRYTGVTGVSVARGCIGNPWIFRQAREMLAGRAPSSPTLAEQRKVLLEHFELALAVNQGMRHAEDFTSKTMRKFGIRFAAHHPRGEEVRKRFIGVNSLEDWRGVLAEWYAAEGASGA
jgi:tRNA-dihydrouridine synthase B